MKPIITTLSRLEPVCVAHAAEMFGILSDSRIYEYLERKAPSSVAELDERYRRY